jgi:hypothetical protein
MYEAMHEIEEADRSLVAEMLAINAAHVAIRRAGRLDCKAVQSILHTLACQMAASGCLPGDVEAVEQTADLIGG